MISGRYAQHRGLPKDRSFPWRDSEQLAPAILLTSGCNSFDGLAFGSYYRHAGDRQ